MPILIVASLEARAGRTTVAAGLGALLAQQGRPVQLGRLRGEEDAEAAADDAQTLSLVPGCKTSGQAMSEQEAVSAAQAAGDELLIVEAPPGSPQELAGKLSGKVVLVTPTIEDLALGDLVSAAGALGDSCVGVIAVRQQERAAEEAKTAISGRGLTCLAVVPEDRLLAGPSPREMAEALHASSLVEGDASGEAVEFVMLGPVSADPGQPYFFQHGAKAVVNRFDKMDLHLAALATEPECLILTGGQQPTPYLLDRVSSGGGSVTVLLAPESTVRTVETIDELYGQTRFGGARKVERSTALLSQTVDLETLSNALR